MLSSTELGPSTAYDWLADEVSDIPLMEEVSSPSMMNDEIGFMNDIHPDIPQIPEIQGHSVEFYFRAEASEYKKLLLEMARAGTPNTEEERVIDKVMSAEGKEDIQCHQEHVIDKAISERRSDTEVRDDVDNTEGKERGRTKASKRKSAIEEDRVSKILVYAEPTKKIKHQIRIITYKGDIYVHGSDLGSVIEVKQNVQRIHNKLSLGTDKEFLNMSLASDHKGGKYCYGYTISGIRKFLDVRKMANNFHYRDWILTCLIPEFLELEYHITKEKKTKKN